MKEFFGVHHTVKSVFFITLLALSGSLTATGEVLKASAVQAEAAKRLATTLEEKHYLRTPLDEAFSKRLHEIFLDRLDSDGKFFAAADLAQLATRELQHGTALKNGDLSFAFEAHDLHLRRHREAVATLTALPATFTVDQLGNAAWVAHFRKEWIERKQAGESDEVLSAELRKVVTEMLKRTEKTGADRLGEVYLDSAARAYDPHSDYMSPRTWSQFKAHLSGSFDGIGVQFDTKDGRLIVKKLTKGGAAETDGTLKVGDEVVAISQNGKDFVEAGSLSTEALLMKIKGKAGTKVWLRYRRENQTHMVELTRQRIVVANAHVKPIQIVDVPTANGNRRIGVLTVPGFYFDQQQKISVAQDVLRAIQKAPKFDLLLVDLRNNGGGSLGEVIKMMGIFVGRIPAVQVADSQLLERGDVIPSPIPQLYDGPLVVAINKGSASASEIFAGVIKDYGRGLIVGDSATFGKGSVQRMLPFEGETEDSELGVTKLTVAGFFRPSGKSTQLVGVKSDIVFSGAHDHQEMGESAEKFPITFRDLLSSVEVSNSPITDSLLGTLARQHQQRRGSDKELIKMATLAKKYHAVSEKKIRLSPAQKEALTKELDALGAMGPAESDEEPGAVPFEKRAYNRELWQIAGDYLDSLAGFEGKLMANVKVLPFNNRLQDFTVRELDKRLHDTVQIPK